MQPRNKCYELMKLSLVIMLGWVLAMNFMAICPTTDPLIAYTGVPGFCVFAFSRRYIWYGRFCRLFHRVQPSAESCESLESDATRKHILEDLEAHWNKPAANVPPHDHK